jgi:hypothetical protein
VHYNEVKAGTHYAFWPHKEESPTEAVAVEYAKGKGWLVIFSDKQEWVRAADLVCLWEDRDRYGRDRATHDEWGGGHSILAQALEFAIDGHAPIEHIGSSSWRSRDYEFVYTPQDLMEMVRYAEMPYPASARPYRLYEGTDEAVAISPDDVRQLAIGLTRANRTGVRAALDTFKAKYGHTLLTITEFHQNRTYVDAYALVEEWLLGSEGGTPPTVLRTWALARDTLHRLATDGMTAHELTALFELEELPR